MRLCVSRHDRDLMTDVIDGDDTDYALLRLAIASRRLGGPMPAIAGVAPDALQAVMDEVPMRVTPELVEAQGGTDKPVNQSSRG